MVLERPKAALARFRAVAAAAEPAAAAAAASVAAFGAPTVRSGGAGGVTPFAFCRIWFAAICEPIEVTIMAIEAGSAI